ncbi:MmcQ/YjbR family DNA-binding protein [Marinilabiliaceae bacterium JC017]|nr:MmcQ/YjbR family DNA-binding protein [Marinilabiliaceae bacterium JC017]
MNIEELRSYCLSKKGATEDLPFDEVTLVFKVAGKMFALTTLNAELSVNLKCVPEVAIELREQFAEVIPGYHMNKKHWNTVDLTGNLSDKQVHEWIDHSYDLVVAGLPKKVREEL